MRLIIISVSFEDCKVPACPKIPLHEESGISKTAYGSREEGDKTQQQGKVEGKGRAFGNWLSMFKISTKRLLQLPVASCQELHPSGNASGTAFAISVGIKQGAQHDSLGKEGMTNSSSSSAGSHSSAHE